MITILVSTSNPVTFDIRGLSTDTKPTEGVTNGSTFIEIDTGDVYMFDGDSSEWNKF